MKPRKTKREGVKPSPTRQLRRRRLKSENFAARLERAVQATLRDRPDLMDQQAEVEAELLAMMRAEK